MSSPGHESAGNEQAAGDPPEPYEPPRVTYTELEVEEALMGICKTATGRGPLGACSDVAPCNSVGS